MSVLVCIVILNVCRLLIGMSLLRLMDILGLVVRGCALCLRASGIGGVLVLGVPLLGVSTSKIPGLVIRGPPSGVKRSSSATQGANTETDRKTIKWGGCLIVLVCDRVTISILQSLYRNRMNISWPIFSGLCKHFRRLQRPGHCQASTSEYFSLSARLILT